LYIFDTWGIPSYYHLLIDHIIPLWITKNMIETKLNIDVGYLTEKAEQTLPIDKLAHLFASAIGVCIKTCTYNDMGIKDYELVEEIVQHITEEFASVRAYNDIEVFNANPKEKED